MPPKATGDLSEVLNVADALKHMGGQPLRFFFLNSHYRSQIDLGIWDWKNPASPIPDGMVASKKAFDTFVRFAERVKRITGKEVADANPFNPDSRPPILDYYTRFRDFMDDDFNTGGAVGVLFELVSKTVPATDKITRTPYHDRLEMNEMQTTPALSTRLTGGFEQTCDVGERSP